MQRLGSLLAVVFVGVCLGAEPEPTYEGKTLGQWSAQANDQDPQLREQSARALGRMGSDAKAAIPILTEMLRDPVVGVRLAAAEALGTMGPQTQSAAIVCLLDVVQSKTKEAAANLDLARRRLYVSDMRLAQRAWEDLQPSRLVELLDGQRPEQTGGTDYRGFEWYYWQRVRNSHLRSLEGHTDLVTCLAFSPDGRQVASGSKDKTVKLWDTSTGKEVLTLTGHTAAVTCLAFSPDGTRLVATCKGVVTVWDLPGGRETLSLTADQGDKVAEIVFRPDGKLLAAATGEVDVWPGLIRLWGAATGKALEPIEIDDEGLMNVAFSPDGRHLALGSWNYVKVWEVADRREVLSIGREETTSRVIYSPDGRWLASTYSESLGTVKVFDAADGEELAKLESQAKRMECVAFSPDGTRIATHSKDDEAAMAVEVWDLASGRKVFRLKLPDRGDGSPVAFSPDLRLVAVGRGRTVRLWDATGNPEAVVCRGVADTLAFAPDDRRLAWAGDGTVRICDAASGQEVLKFGREPMPRETRSERATGAVFGPGGQWLASARGTEVFFWHLRTGEELLALKGPEGPKDEIMARSEISSLAVSPDGKWLAAGTSGNLPGAPGEIKVCRIPKLLPGQPTKDSLSPDKLLLLKGHKYEVTSLAFRPDGAQLASASDDGTIRLWEIPSLVALSADHREAGLAQDRIDTALAQQARPLTAQSSIECVAYSPDGTLLASAGHDATVGLWNPATGRELRVLRGHTRAVNCVAFSPDGKQLASGSGDWTEPGELKLWDVTSGQELLSLIAPEGVHCVAFSHCGRRLAVCGQVGQTFCHPDLAPALQILDARPLTDEIGLQREAVSVYRHAAQTKLLHDEVTAQIRQDRSVSEAVRQQALAWAEHFQEDSNRLNEASLAIVQDAEAEAAEYRQALRYAEAADRLRPDTVEYLNTLGMARYRLGQFQAALSTLTRVRDLIQARDRSERKGHPAPPSTDQDSQSMPLGTPLGVLLENSAFLAMTQHQLGQREQARAHIEELRKKLKALETRGMFGEEDSQTFLQEAETLIQEDPSKPEFPNSKTPANSNDQ